VSRLVEDVRCSEDRIVATLPFRTPIPIRWRPLLLLLLLVSLWGLMGCGDPAGDMAARVGDRVLSADRLAQLMVLAQPMPLTAEVASELASHWVTLIAFGQRMAAGDSLLDSTTIHDLMRYRIRQAVIAEWRRRLLAPIPAADVARFDSSYPRELLSERRARLDLLASEAGQEFRVVVIAGCKINRAERR